MIRKEYRDDSPDSIGYVEEDHPLRPTAAQSVRLLQVPPSEDDHNTYSFTASFTDMDVPIFTRETAFERDRQHVSKKQNHQIRNNYQIQSSRNLLSK